MSLVGQLDRVKGVRLTTGARMLIAIGSLTRVVGQDGEESVGGVRGVDFGMAR